MSRKSTDKISNLFFHLKNSQFEKKIDWLLLTTTCLDINKINRMSCWRHRNLSRVMSQTTKMCVFFFFHSLVPSLVYFIARSALIETLESERDSVHVWGVSIRALRPATLHNANYCRSYFLIALVQSKERPTGNHKTAKAVKQFPISFSMLLRYLTLHTIFCVTLYDS